MCFPWISVSCGMCPSSLGIADKGGSNGLWPRLEARSLGFYTTPKGNRSLFQAPQGKLGIIAEKSHSECSGRGGRREDKLPPVAEGLNDTCHRH